jgi:rRNA-processing protein FCF1
MAKAQSDLLILDANVLIDYCSAERAILTLISENVGRIHVPTLLLEEVQALDASECDRLGLHVFEPEMEMVSAAGKRRPGLSFYDHLCLLLTKQEAWTCVTNDGKLRRECGVDGVPVLWGLEPMIALVEMGQLTGDEAKKVARAIQAENPFYITDKVIKAFEGKIEAAPKRTRRR